MVTVVTCCSHRGNLISFGHCYLVWLPITWRSIQWTLSMVTWCNCHGHLMRLPWLSLIWCCCHNYLMLILLTWCLYVEQRQSSNWPSRFVWLKNEMVIWCNDVMVNVCVIHRDIVILEYCVVIKVTCCNSQGNLGIIICPETSFVASC